MKKILFAALVAFSATSFAAQPTTPPGNAYGLYKNKTVINVPPSTSTVNNGGAGGAGGSATATGGSATATNSVTVNTVEPGASVIAPGTTALLTTSGTTGEALVSTSVSNTNTYEAAASTAYGPALTSGSDTCMGSTSVGGSGVGFGFSVGSTWTDENCVMLKNARLLYGMGQDKVAFALMCQDEDVRAAAAAAKVNMCPPVEKKETKGSDAPSQGWTF